MGIVYSYFSMRERETFARSHFLKLRIKAAELVVSLSLYPGRLGAKELTHLHVPAALQRRGRRPHRSQRKDQERALVPGSHSKAG